MRWTLCLCLALGACEQGVDLDGDGATEGIDCNDADSAVLPGVVEACDGLDNDCDGEVDEDPEDGTTSYLDLDGDGYGDPATAMTTCVVAEGRMTLAGDCNDADPAFHPDATEECGAGIDYNCDGAIDLVDGDNDGSLACVDCDDSNDNRHPGNPEICDGDDQDCDDEADEDAIDARDWYPDDDGDGLGDEEGAPERACDAPPGEYADNALDCNDDDETIGRTGITWYRDDDGDGLGDANSTKTACKKPSDDYVSNADDCDDGDKKVGAATAWHADTDDDDFGDPHAETFACDAPKHHVADSTDCDDTSDDVNPDGIEVCNDLDDDCNGTVDDGASDAHVLYVDLDGDGYGTDDSTSSSCGFVDGFVENALDCDDTDPEVTGASHVWYADKDADGVADRDASWVSCDAQTAFLDDADDCDDEDDAVGGPTAWYADTDGDGFGNPDAETSACEAPADHVADATDCDDAKDQVHPGATEVCNYRDDDCDGTVDQGAANAPVVYLDEDQDGFGTPDWSVIACVHVAGFVDNALDCNDADDSVTVASHVWYADEDEDGVADRDESWLSCDEQTGLVDDGDDCDDADKEVGAPASWYADTDGDGFGDPYSETSACAAPADHVADATDCDDGIGEVHPDATEVCNYRDDDCDGTVDQGAENAQVVYWDGDEDGFGTPDVSEAACGHVAGFVDNALDCDDSEDAPGARHPNADEICDGIDNDCDGLEDEDASYYADWYTDADGDGYGDADTGVFDCNVDETLVADGTDCDDDASDDEESAADAFDVHPLADELCDELDNDCDGEVDEAGALYEPTWYPDADGDTFGDGTAAGVTACVPPKSSWAANDDDCDDDPVTGPIAFPGNPEVCDDRDNDCENGADDGLGTANAWYRDEDDDGYGTDDTLEWDCDEDRITPWTSLGGDCDDDASDDTESAADAFDVHPTADELCDEVDNDCDDLIDDDDPDSELIEGRPEWYPDADEDGFGDWLASPTAACDEPFEDFVADNTDCDDDEPLTNPLAAEICDEIDQDCNGEPKDPGAYGEKEWWPDQDEDDFGAALDEFGQVIAPTVACDPPDDKWADNDDDCDDTDPTTGDDYETFYRDADGDGLGDAFDSAEACFAEQLLPDVYVENKTDCDDSTEQVGGPTAWYYDGDGDGWGAGTPVIACAAANRVTGDGDCNDDPSNGVPFHPGATDTCDGQDRDCDCVWQVSFPSECSTLQSALDGAAKLDVDYTRTPAACDARTHLQMNLVTDAIIDIEAGTYTLNVKFPTASTDKNSRVTVRGAGSETTVLKPFNKALPIWNMPDYGRVYNWYDNTAKKWRGTNIEGLTFAEGDLCNGLTVLSQCSTRQFFQGAAIRVEGSSPRIADTAFCDNRAHYGGAVSILSAGLGEPNNEGKVRFHNVSFYDNRATGDGGGLDAYYSNWELNDGWFEGNQSLNSSGAVNLSEQGFDPRIRRTMFRNNTACYDGGAIRTARWLTLEDTSFENNTAGRFGYGVMYSNYTNAFTWMNIGAVFTGNVDNSCDAKTGEYQLEVHTGYDPTKTTITYTGNLTLGQIKHQAGDVLHGGSNAGAPQLDPPQCGN